MIRYALPGERRRTARRRLLGGVGAALAAAALALAGWVWLLPRLALAALSEHAAVTVRAGAIDFNPWTGTLRLSDVRIGAPAGFPPGDMLDVRRLEAKFDPASLLSPVVRVRSLVVEIPSCTVATNAAGLANWGVFGARLRASLGASPPWTLAPLALVRSRDARFDRIDLSLARVRVVDGRPAPPRVAVLEPALRESVRAVPSLREAWERLGTAALADTARAAMESNDNHAGRTLSSIVRSLGVRPRLRDSTIDELLETLWPEDTPAPAID
jgi:hypothetical protein